MLAQTEIEKLIELRSLSKDKKIKACINQKIFRLRNPEKVKAIAKRKYDKIDKTCPEYKRKCCESSKKYAQNNPDKVKARRSEYLISKRDSEEFKLKHKIRNLRYRIRNQDKVRENKRRVQAEWVKNNPDKARMCYVKFRSNMTDQEKKEYYARQTSNRMQKENYRIETRLRARCRKAVIAAGSKKASKTLNLVGGSWQSVREWIESKFTQGMNWDNIGMWHIDHIKPCISFDLSKEDEQMKCFHYTNLQPLWAKDNLSKGCKVA